MKCRLWLVCAILLFVNGDVAFGGENAIRKFMRWTGYGMSDGYHTCPCPTARECGPAFPKIFSSPMEREIPRSAGDCGCARREATGSFAMVNPRSNEPRRDGLTRYQGIDRDRQAMRGRMPIVPKSAQSWTAQRANPERTGSAWLRTYDVRLNN